MKLLPLPMLFVPASSPRRARLIMTESEVELEAGYITAPAGVFGEIRVSRWRLKH
jgi:hypothetical protein